MNRIASAQISKKMQPQIFKKIRQLFAQYQAGKFIT